MPRGEHYTKNTLATTRWCHRCKRETRWRVNNGHPVECEDCNLRQRIQEHAARIRRGEVTPLRRQLANAPTPARSTRRA